MNSPSKHLKGICHIPHSVLLAAFGLLCLVPCGFLSVPVSEVSCVLYHKSSGAVPEPCASLQFFLTSGIFITSGSKHLGSFLILSFERCSDQFCDCRRDP